MSTRNKISRRMLDASTEAALQKAESALQTGDPSLAAVATSGEYADLKNKPTLATVATSGDYSDLQNKPSLGDAASKNVGTSAGTVAAGDDSRIVNARLISGNDRIVTVTDSSSTTWNAQNGRTEVAILTATGNRTITAPSNPIDGQRVIFAHTASGGARTPTFNTGTGAFNLRGKEAPETPSGKTTYYGFIYNQAANRWNLLAIDEDASE